MKRTHLDTNQVDTLTHALRTASRAFADDSKEMDKISKQPDEWFEQNKLITRTAARQLSEQFDRYIENISDLLDIIEEAEDIIIEREDD